ncbi:Hypothetical protein BQ3484_383 [Cedratvirus A11]|uniref:Uncharacterized protein n=1 Tax=Cedratvirus A11 TaxID=1903266 RepID=A0A1M7XUV5_9VIRU|nr:Hypothetical protein BQ3484_383 [Cedratvirus A11]SHO33451.1 Hypothetical protein BQ3484_383 [Cedratvirus A11]
MIRNLPDRKSLWISFLGTNPRSVEMQFAGYSEVDELYIPPNRDNLDEVVKLCNAGNMGYLYRSMYNHKYWERQFENNRTFLVRKQNNAADWANELLHSVTCVQKARTIFSNFKGLGKDPILTYLNSVNTSDIFPDFLDRHRINSLLLYSRVRHDEGESIGRIILKNDPSPKIIFEVGTRKYKEKLTDDQTFYLLFLFCYYALY